MLKFPGKRPTNLGVRDGKLAPCPSSPNCVSSLATDAAHAIEPLPADGADAMANLRRVIEAMPRTRIVTAEGDYLYAEFESALLGFVDDVEFQKAGDVIHVRSASRLGYSDLGVNRTRIEEIRAAFEQRSA